MGMFGAVHAEHTERVLRAKFEEARVKYADKPEALEAVREFFTELLHSGICDE